MGFRISNNIAAMNTQRWLGVSDAGMKKSLERLSSGYRINKAADDAAGLAISQSFRANIAAFKVASRNTSEANALLQVAEGGMEQIGNMLTRLKELATQAASANVGATERMKINSEATALTDEIDRISNSTKYGSTSLLDGNFGASLRGTLGAGTAGDGIVDDANDNVIYDFTISGAAGNNAKVTALGSDVAEGTWYVGYTQSGSNQELVIQNADKDASIQEFATISAGATSVSFANLNITISYTAGTISGAGLFAMTTAGNTTFTTAGSSTVKFERTGLTSTNVTAAASGTYDITETAAGFIKVTNSAGTATQTLQYQSSTSELDFNVLGIKFTLAADYSNTTKEMDGTQLTVTTNTDATGNTFQVGSENNSNNQIDITIAGVDTATLSIDSLDLSSSSGAQAALTTIDTAISTLAGSRGTIGAYMNRLGYAAANLATTIENQQAAESIIRDVDMASEMTDFTKNQILLQAGTAMLAQANIAPQQVLALFG